MPLVFTGCAGYRYSSHAHGTSAIYSIHIHILFAGINLNMMIPITLLAAPAAAARLQVLVLRRCAIIVFLPPSLQLMLSALSFKSHNLKPFLQPELQANAPTSAFSSVISSDHICLAGETYSGAVGFKKAGPLLMIMNGDSLFASNRHLRLVASFCCGFRS